MSFSNELLLFKNFKIFFEQILSPVFVNEDLFLMSIFIELSLFNLKLSNLLFFFIFFKEIKLTIFFFYENA